MSRDYQSNKSSFSLIYKGERKKTPPWATIPLQEVSEGDKTNPARLTYCTVNSPESELWAWLNKRLLILVNQYGLL